MTDEELKKEFVSRKDVIKRAFSERIRYDTWDKESPIYVFNILDNTIEKITDKKQIRERLFLLDFVQYFVAFYDEELAKTYQWMHDTIETVIDEKISEAFSYEKSCICKY